MEDAFLTNLATPRLASVLDQIRTAEWVTQGDLADMMDLDFSPMQPPGDVPVGAYGPGHGLSLAA
jgi:hypothetical protein